jgi:hypothetical protein
MSLVLSESELKEVARLMLQSLAASSDKNYRVILLGALVGQLAAFVAMNMESELGSKTIDYVRTIPEFDETMLPYKLAAFLNTLDPPRQLILVSTVLTDV